MFHLDNYSKTEVSCTYWREFEGSVHWLIHVRLNIQRLSIYGLGRSSIYAYGVIDDFGDLVIVDWEL